MRQSRLGYVPLRAWGDNEICAHHAIGVLLANFRNEEGTHASTSTTSEGVGTLLPNNIKDSVDEFGTFRVVALRPVVTCSAASALSRTRKLSGQKSSPRGPEQTASMVPGSRLTKIARGTVRFATLPSQYCPSANMAVHRTHVD